MEDREMKNPQESERERDQKKPSHGFAEGVQEEPYPKREGQGDEDRNRERKPA
jgi:hypothetical protein